MDDDGVRWLDDTETASWIPLLTTVMWLPAALNLQLQRDAGLSTFEYGVLAALSESEGRTIRLRELARIANSTLSRLSKVVNRLSSRAGSSAGPIPRTAGRPSPR
ncbi:hypothetical protein Q0F99_10625 [Rathayibacter oskolensis]|uniref:hypothetical protein n=1 Tax=Rathayibacter oskolensis TaxID=1891671 RepID=UPI00265E11F5|nr:hypothetical protein [Rathayibacter oskolensis]WKK70349.1 hypothetical protein Q0F99_10625 [Rathayibacter oskolensis]